MSIDGIEDTSIVGDLGIASVILHVVLPATDTGFKVVDVCKLL